MLVFCVLLFLDCQYRFGDGLQPGFRNRLAARIRETIGSLLNFLKRTFDSADATLIDDMECLLHLAFSYVLHVVFGCFGLPSMLRLILPSALLPAHLRDQELRA